MSFTYEFEGLEVETKEGDFLYVYGSVEFELQDNSFDYAGTHCTHGQSGTHDPGDSAEIESVHINEVFDEDNKSVHLGIMVAERLVEDKLTEDDGDLIFQAHKQIETSKEIQAADRHEHRDDH